MIKLLLTEFDKFCSYMVILLYDVNKYEEKQLS
jgi:hypothetical protein